MLRETGTPLRVEISEETLYRLLREGQVCAADFRCLDCRTKQCLRLLCLKSCARRITLDTDSVPQKEA